MTTIVLAPGFGSYKDIEWDYSPFTNWYIKNGFNVVKYRQQNYGTDCIKKNSESLSRLINKIDDSYIVLLGHSMGGLVAAMSAHSDQSRVNKLITIAAPLRGTPWAKLFPITKSIKQMQPNSRLLSTMDFLMCLHGCPMMNVSCRWDALVPAKNATLDWADKKLLVNHTHTSVVFSRNVFNETLEFIKR